jgi:hypothetical protein
LPFHFHGSSFVFFKIKIEIIEWDKEIIRNMVSILEDTIFEPQVIVLSIFGYTNTITELDLQENTLTLILQELGRVPDKILVPSEGNSSIYIQEWAESLHIKTQIFQSDWSRNGKIAQMIRDDRMAKECTHALVFLSQRSKRLETFSEKLAKKGKTVFTSCHVQTLTLLVVPAETSYQASKPVRKSNTKIGQMWQKYQKKE